MSRKNYRLSAVLISVGVCLEILLIPNFSIPAQAKLVSENPTPGNNRSIAIVTFDPPGDGQPDDSVGGASRDGGQCPQDRLAANSPLTPLMPTTNYGLTTAERPTFFVYIPQTSAQKVFFSLQDQTKTYHYQTILPITGKQGIVGFKLPDGAPPLQTGKSYQWSFAILCGNALRPDSPMVQGWVRRTELKPTVSSQLKQANSLQRAISYGKEGIWYDTLTSLAEAQRLQPQDPTLVASWEELLKSVGLEAIATKPLVQ